jgi:hypothetical protein
MRAARATGVALMIYDRGPFQMRLMPEMNPAAGIDAGGNFSVGDESPSTMQLHSRKKRLRYRQKSRNNGLIYFDQRPKKPR